MAGARNAGGSSARCAACRSSRRTPGCACAAAARCARKGLVVLRELAAWREEFARERNKPRASIARDEALVEIARKAPTTLEGLRGLRAVRSRELERHAGDVVQRIARALETPSEDVAAAAAAAGSGAVDRRRRAAAGGAAAARRRGRHRAELAGDARGSAGARPAPRRRRRRTSCRSCRDGARPSPAAICSRCSRGAPRWRSTRPAAPCG